MPPLFISVSPWGRRSRREAAVRELVRAVAVYRSRLEVLPVEEGEGVWIGHSGQLEIKRIDAALAALRSAWPGIGE